MNDADGYYELTVKQLEDLKNVYNIQASKGNWDYDPYMHGMFNGMEMMMSIIENREPKFRKAPKKWVADIPMPQSNSSEQGITNKLTITIDGMEDNSPTPSLEKEQQPFLEDCPVVNRIKELGDDK